ncbi:hypothetical protein Hanom_Chr13g01185951 [Helianthus anomalus]
MESEWQQKSRKDVVVYFLCKDRHLEPAHFIEVALASSEERVNILSFGIQHAEFGFFVSFRWFFRFRFGSVQPFQFFFFFFFLFRFVFLEVKSIFFKRKQFLTNMTQNPFPPVPVSTRTKKTFFCN